MSILEQILMLFERMSNDFLNKRVNWHDKRMLTGTGDDKKYSV